MTLPAVQENSKDANQDEANDKVLDTNARAKIKIIPDEPASEDALESQIFDKYSKKLADIIRYSRPKFAIGVFGEWGTGKTTLMGMIEKQLKENYHPDVLPVWFNAWKYEREKYLAAVPLLRTIKITLDKDKNSRTESWKKVEKALGKTFNAFVGSADLTIPVGASPKINLEKLADTVKASGYTRIDGKKVLYQKHATDDLEESLHELRKNKEDRGRRIVIFIDDLDRCHPTKALEVLDSIKTFFDIEGIVYVIGMNVDSIDPIINEKYKEAFDVKGKGLEYLQKIVQLKVTIPNWKEVDVTQYISKIILEELKESEFFDEFKKNSGLIANTVQKNPRELKRTINELILSRSVKEVDLKELIIVKAIEGRPKWKKFLELITPKAKRENFLRKYDSFGSRLKGITSEQQLTDISKDDVLSKDKEFQTWLNDNFELCGELIKQGKVLSDFLDDHITRMILLNTKDMEGNIKAVAAGTLELPETRQHILETEKLIKLLHEGDVDQFNKIITESKLLNLNFSRANLSGAKLSHANLSGINLSRADLSSTNLSHTKLTGANLIGAYLLNADLSHAELIGADLSRALLYGANLKYANLSGADLQGANLKYANLATNRQLKFANERTKLMRTYFYQSNLQGADLSGVDFQLADLSGADLSQSVIISPEHFDTVICDGSNFDDAIISDENLLVYLKNKNVKTLPTVTAEDQLQQKLDKRISQLREDMRDEYNEG